MRGSLGSGVKPGGRWALPGTGQGGSSGGGGVSKGLWEVAFSRFISVCCQMRMTGGQTKPLCSSKGAGNLSLSALPQEVVQSPARNWDDVFVQALDSGPPGAQTRYSPAI